MLTFVCLVRSSATTASHFLSTDDGVVGSAPDLQEETRTQHTYLGTGQTISEEPRDHCTVGSPTSNTCTWSSNGIVIAAQCFSFTIIAGRSSTVFGGCARSRWSKGAIVGRSSGRWWVSLTRWSSDAVFIIRVVECTSSSGVCHASHQAPCTCSYGCPFSTIQEIQWLAVNVQASMVSSLDDRVLLLKNTSPAAAQASIEHCSHCRVLAMKFGIHSLVHAS